MTLHVSKTPLSVSDSADFAMLSRTPATCLHFGCGVEELCALCFDDFKLKRDLPMAPFLANLTCAAVLTSSWQISQNLIGQSLGCADPFVHQATVLLLVMVQQLTLFSAHIRIHLKNG
jgi:hypothetical protein